MVIFLLTKVYATNCAVDRRKSLYVAFICTYIFPELPFMNTLWKIHRACSPGVQWTLHPVEFYFNKICKRKHAKETAHFLRRKQLTLHLIVIVVIVIESKFIVNLPQVWDCSWWNYLLTCCKWTFNLQNCVIVYQSIYEPIGTGC